MSAKRAQGFAVIISSPSGVGKTTVTKQILKKVKKSKLSVSWTTRTPRLNEKNKEDYIFTNKKSFFKNVKNKKFLEYAKVFNNYYGTPKKEIYENFKKGKIIILDIDWQGSKKVKKIIAENCISIFLLPPSFATLKQRLVNRHKKDSRLATKRFSYAKRDIKHWRDYDYVIINNKLSTCVESIIKIINYRIFARDLEIIAAKKIKNIIKIK